MSSSRSDALFPALPKEISAQARGSIRTYRASHPSPSLERFARPYYGLHLIATLAYFPIRQFLLPFVNPKVALMAWNTDDRENQMFLILCVLLFTKFRRANTLEAWLSVVMRYSKICVLFAAYVVDLRLCAWFFMIYACITLAGPKEPTYSGPSLVKEVGAEFFKASIDNKLAADRDLNYIVLMYSLKSEECTWFESEFARTSLRYGYAGSSVVFCQISLDAFPEIIDKFQILMPEVDRFNHELPTVMMFQAGSVLARLPEVGKKTLMNESNLVRAMDLEARARVPAEVAGASAEKKAGGDAKKKSK